MLIDVTNSYELFIEARELIISKWCFSQMDLSLGTTESQKGPKLMNIFYEDWLNMHSVYPHIFTFEFPICS